MAWPITTPPTHCDLCGDVLKDVFIDGALIPGGWAIMDEKCFKLVGAGLGTGKGQKYDLRTGKKLDG